MCSSDLQQANKASPGPKALVKTPPSSSKKVAKSKVAPVSTAAMPTELKSIFFNPTSATREIVYTVTDFFDSTGDETLQYQQIQMSMENPLGMLHAQGTPTPFGRVEKFDLYALPRSVNAAVASSTLAVLFGLPVVGGSVPSDETTAGNEAKGTAATRTTILTPTSVSDWVHVGHWDRKTLELSSQSLQAQQGMTVLGAMTVVDPDKWTPVTSKIQYMAKTTIRQSLPNTVEVTGTVPSGGNANMFNIASTATPGKLDLMVEAIGVSKID